MDTLIPVENENVLSAVRGFLRQLMEKGVVEALFVPLEAEGGSVVPALVTDPDLLKLANPLAPVMAINGARAVSAITGKQAPAKLGAVLRSCEIRALIELVKLQQATLDDVTLIAIDCLGTYEMNEYLQKQGEGGVPLANYLAAAGGGRGPVLSGLELRPACQMCTQPIFENAEIRLHLIGEDLNHGIPISMPEELATRLEMKAFPEASSTGDLDRPRRKEAVDRLIASSQRIREKELADIRARLTSDGGIASLFAACIRCHNCSTACPICYCKTCLFRTSAFERAPGDYLTAARRKGALRMLSDTLLFHMTRMNHMSVSCVSCGLCTSACPADIPVSLIFSAVGAQVQNIFSYSPGRDVNEPLPLITFQANEWVEIGEER